MMKKTLLITVIMLVSIVLRAQFSSQKVISSNADNAKSVYAIDLDGDNDIDILSASENDNKIAWYENLGGWVFGVENIITTSAISAKSVFAIDLDGDNDADVLSASKGDNIITWCENVGEGSFSLFCLCDKFGRW